MKNLLWSGVLMMASAVSFAQTTVELGPDKDNSIYAESENSSGLGKIYAGLNCDGDIRRGLIHFDISGTIPPGAVVTDVSLTLNVEAAGVDAATDDYGLYLVTKNWGEGTSADAVGGSPAIAPDATWLDAMFGTDAWGTPGGDFVATASAVTNLDAALGDYSWSSATMVTDVQGWVTDPTTNYGWVLRGEEASTCTDRTFGSKDGGVAPILEITYTCAGGDPLAVCQSITVELDAVGEATIADEDLDGGSAALCGGALTFSASQTIFSCEDIFAGPTPPSLVLSAVYDATLSGGTPKGIELYVINDIEDLSDYGIGSANNGGGTDGQEFTFPAVSVTAGSYIYVSTDSVRFEEWFGFFPNYNSGSMSINGDDAVELFMSGVVIDVFGDIDTDGSGTAWDYVDGFAYRVSNTGPDEAVFTLGNWIFSGANEWDGDVSNATAELPMPVGTFVTAPTVGTPVTLTVTDEDMNTAECATVITLIDAEAPVMSCVGASTIVLDETGMVVLTAADLDAGTLDGCGIDSLWISMDTLTCENEGDNEIMLYAVDTYGNVDSCAVMVTIDASEVITITTDSELDPTCTGFADGSIGVSITGGTPAYVIGWENTDTGDTYDTEDLNTLLAGTYEVLVEDDNGCVATASYVLDDPEPVLVETVIVNETCEGSADGSVDITITGGTEPYTVIGDLTGLTAGEYTIVVNDAEGCSASVDVTITVENEIDLTVTENLGVSITANQAGATYQWINCPDFGIIDGATEQTFNPIFSDGDQFACIVTIDAGCSDTTECVDFIFESIDEEGGVTVSLYPNPTEDVLNIALDGVNGFATVTVMDIKGSILIKQVITNSVGQLNLADLEKGIYIIQINAENSILTRKINLN